MRGPRFRRMWCRRRVLLVIVTAATLACPAGALADNDFSTSPQDVPLDRQNYDSNTGATAFGEIFADGSTTYCPHGGGTLHVSHTRWYRFTGTGGPMVVSTEGSSVNKQLGRIAVRVNENRHVLANPVRPIPMWQYMDGWRLGPPITAV